MKNILTISELIFCHPRLAVLTCSCVLLVCILVEEPAVSIEEVVEHCLKPFSCIQWLTGLILFSTVLRWNVILFTVEKWERVENWKRPWKRILWVTDGKTVLNFSNVQIFIHARTYKTRHRPMQRLLERSRARMQHAIAWYHHGTVVKLFWLIFIWLCMSVITKTLGACQMHDMQTDDWWAYCFCRTHI